MLRACAGIDAVIHSAGEPRGLPEIVVHTFRSNALRRSSPSMPRSGAGCRASCAPRASMHSAPSSGG